MQYAYCIGSRNLRHVKSTNSMNMAILKYSRNDKIWKAWNKFYGLCLHRNVFSEESSITCFDGVYVISFSHN